MSRVVADTGIFYALLDEKDSYHQRAQSEMEKIVDTNTTVYSLPSQRIGRGTKEKMCFKVFDICSKFIKI